MRPGPRGHESDHVYTLIVMIWFSTLFGGEGLEGRPIKATLEFPTEAGCKKMQGELIGYKLKHEVIMPCSKVEAERFE